MGSGSLLRPFREGVPRPVFPDPVSFAALVEASGTGGAASLVLRVFAAAFFLASGASFLKTGSEPISSTRAISAPSPGLMPSLRMRE